MQNEAHALNALIGETAAWTNPLNDAEIQETLDALQTKWKEGGQQPNNAPATNVSCQNLAQIVGQLLLGTYHYI
jgi:hypothetical protein